MQLERARDCLHETVAAELARRDVHRDAHPRSGSMPLRGALHRLHQGPVAELLDKLGFLGNRDEQRRRDEATGRMLPAHQRLDADDGSAREIHLRLVMQLELLLRERRAQRVLKLDAVERLARHVGGIELEGVAARLLDAVRGRIGVAQQHVEILAVARIHARTHAQRDVDLAPVQREGGRQRPAHGACDAQHVVRARDVRREQGEVIGADPRHGIAAAQRFREALADRLEQRVAGGMAVAVGEQLQAVDAADHERAAAAGALRVRDRLRGAVAEEAAIRQRSERIVIRQVLQPRLVGLALADVARDGRAEPDLAVCAAMRDHHLRHRHGGAIRAEHGRFALP